MIKSPTKRKLLADLEKSGNVSISCMKSGISRATFYRWKNENEEFRKKADEAEIFGRESNCDIAEQALMLKVKEKDMNAIKYMLGHNSPRYKGKETSNVVIVHKKELLKTNPADEFGLPKEFACLSDDEVLEWLNGVVTDLKDGKTSGKYYAADTAELESESRIIPFASPEEDEE